MYCLCYIEPYYVQCTLYYKIIESTLNNLTVNGPFNKPLFSVHAPNKTNKYNNIKRNFRPYQRNRKIIGRI